MLVQTAVTADTTLLYYIDIYIAPFAHAVCNQQIYPRSFHLPITTLLGSNRHSSISPSDNRLATSDMVRIRRHLTFDAAVPIDMTITTTLGRDADLVRAGRVGAGLGRPVAAGALESSFYQAVSWANTRYPFHQ